MGTNFTDGLSRLQNFSVGKHNGFCKLELNPAGLNPIAGQDVQITGQKVGFSQMPAREVN